MNDINQNLLKTELFRKSIHISSMLVPLISIFVGLWVAIAFVVIISIMYLISEYLRVRGRELPIFMTITKLAARPDVERMEGPILSPIYLSIGILSSLLIFPEPTSYAAITVLALGDGVSSIIGKTFGKRKIWFSDGKTIEGTGAGFVCAFGGTLLFVSPVLALVGATVGMLVELVPIRINDNISVPISVGFAIIVASLIAGSKTI